MSKSSGMAKRSIAAKKRRQAKYEELVKKTEQLEHALHRRNNSENQQ